uniref:Uncharacterized protein n=2 Tax=Hemiselmis andersenii TaxID=464988 RepID=A0A7S1EIL2_HEMAN|mmetsp:Transcript_49016/g.118927  ORF Transcript_49016/g.118927 Transcript_49016/m.118927 type:complete len:556 (+) Transcript_49016:153-1820(+)
MERINREGARKHYYKGVELLKPGPEQDLEAAISEFSKAIFLVDDQPEYFAKRGHAYMLLKDYKTAVSNFRRSLKLLHTAELGRRTSNLLDAEGLARLRHQELPDAIFLFSAALDLDPSNIYCYVHRALAQIGQSKLDEALKGLNIYLEREQKPKAKLLIHLLVARINKQIKNPTTAAVHVNWALKIDPVNEEALRLYVQLKGRAGELFAEATAYLLRNQPLKAVDCLKHAIELDPKDTRFLVRRGVIYRQMGKYNDAVADLEAVIELTKGTSTDALRQLAITYNQLGIELYSAREYTQALGIFNLAMKHDSESPSICINRGDCYREMQEVGLALEDYLHAHKLNEADSEVRIRLSTLYDARGLTYFDRGMLDDSYREFSQAITFLPQVPHYYIHRATTAMELGNFESAVQDFREVVKIDPHNEQAWAKLSALGDHGPGDRYTSDSPKRGRRQQRKSLKTTEGTLAGAAGVGGLPARVKARSRSPTRTSVEELAFTKALSDRKGKTVGTLRSQLAYKSGKKLDTGQIDDKYADIVSGMPTGSVKGVANPYPEPIMK